MGFFKEQHMNRELTSLSDDHLNDAGAFMVDLIENLEEFVADDDAREAPHPAQLSLAQIRTEWGVL